MFDFFLFCNEMFPPLIIISFFCLLITDSNNRHSDVNAAKKYEDDCCVTNFQKLSPAVQMSEIKKWLNFYNEVSPDTCSLIIRTFKGNLKTDLRQTSYFYLFQRFLLLKCPWS